MTQQVDNISSANSTYVQKRKSMDIDEAQVAEKLLRKMSEGEDSPFMEGVIDQLHTKKGAAAAGQFFQDLADDSSVEEAKKVLEEAKVKGIFPDNFLSSRNTIFRAMQLIQNLQAQQNVLLGTVATTLDKASQSVQNNTNASNAILNQKLQDVINAGKEGSDQDKNSDVTRKNAIYNAEAQKASALTNELNNNLQVASSNMQTVQTAQQQTVEFAKGFVSYISELVRLMQSM